MPLTKLYTKIRRRKRSDIISPTYRPLFGTEVRFIKLLPNSRADPIRCNLVYLPLINVPCYIALSYVWGDPKVTQEIYLDDSSFWITVNLFAALQQLRDFLVDSSNAPKVFQNEDVLFWIDALCIDQSNLGEKAIQVPRMSQIYGSADLVVAWLGENRVHDHMVGMIMAMCKHVDSNTSPDDFTSLHLHPFPINGLDCFIEAFHDLLSRHWFRRIWVVQEIVLAPNIPIYLAGSHWCLINHLWWFWRNLYRSKKFEHTTRGLNIGVRLEMHVAMRHSMYKLWAKMDELIMERSEQVSKTYENDLSVAIEDSHFTSSLPGTIIKTLGDGRPDLSKSMEVEIIAFLLSKAMKKIPIALEASIPHDQIYGLLSLAKVAEIPKELMPDYTIPFPNVFHTYAKIILEHEQDLSILPRRENGLSGVPSWVPDFRSHSMDLGSRVRINSSVQIVGHGKVCITEGVHLGEVTLATVYKLGKDVTNAQELRECLHTFETFLQNVCQIRNLERNTTLEVCLSNWYRDPTPVRVEKLRRFYDCAIAELQAPSPVEQFDRTIANEFLSKATDQSLVLTSSGILARLTRLDESAKEGDILSIMKGTHYPFLLRPTTVEGEYTFIGSCQIFFGKSKAGATEEYFAASTVQKFRLV